MGPIIQTIIILNTARHLAEDDKKDWRTLTQSERDVYLQQVWDMLEKNAKKETPSET